MKRFKTYKNSSNKNIFIFVSVFLLSIGISINFLCRENLVKNNTLIESLMFDFNKSYKITDIDFLLKYALDLEIKEDNFAMKEEIIDKSEEEIKDESKDNAQEETIIDKTKPLIYIYNTHQSEKYKSGYLETYNITSTVLTASRILKEYLEDLGFSVLVEEDDITAKIHALNLKYGSSYKVARMYMESAKEKYPSLEYFIDLHRDSSVYDKTTTTINGEGYVKLLFVVGLDHTNYEPNLKLAEDLSAILKKYDEKLYRGIMKKSGKGVNGIYNQDFSSKTMLVEVGGQYNNISEVNNTLKVFAKVLSDYIKENQSA